MVWCRVPCCSARISALALPLGLRGGGLLPLGLLLDAGVLLLLSAGPLSSTLGAAWGCGGGPGSLSGDR